MNRRQSTTIICGLVLALAALAFPGWVEHGSGLQKPAGRHFLYAPPLDHYVRGEWDTSTKVTYSLDLGRLLIELTAIALCLACLVTLVSQSAAWSPWKARKRPAHIERVQRRHLRRRTALSDSDADTGTSGESLEDPGQPGGPGKSKRDSEAINHHAAQRILWVDDDPNMLAAGRRLLESEGHEIDTAESADAAFELMAQKPYQLVLTDIPMPKMWGNKFVRIAKERYPDTVFIYVTAYWNDEVEKDVTDGIVAQLIRTPYRMEQMLWTVENVVGRGGEGKAP